MTTTPAASGPTAAISGLVSGMNTADIIDQLMTLNAQPQAQLKTRVTTEQGMVTALQSLNSQIAAIGTKATSLANATAWKPVAVSSSSSGVTVSAAAGAGTGSVSFAVNRLASAYGARFDTTATLDTRVSGTSGTTVTVTSAAGTKTIATGDGSLQGLVDAVNAAGTGLRASTVRLDDGTYRLRIDSTTTGADSTFSITDSDGNPLMGGATVAAPAADAEISVAGDLIHSKTNTFSDLVPGLSVTLSPSALGSNVTVSSSRDVGAVSSSVQDLVNAINAAIDNLSSLTSYNTTTNASGVLAGDSAVRSLTDALRNALYPGDGSTMAKVGIQLDRTGHFTFDANAFSAAYQADPDGTSAMFTATTHGFADRIAKVAVGASDSTTGTLTSSISSHNDSIKRLNDSIASWDIRLDMQRQSLTVQFTAMETALNVMQSQSSWLAGQISQLTANASASK